MQIAVHRVIFFCIYYNQQLGLADAIGKRMPRQLLQMSTLPSLIIVNTGAYKLLSSISKHTLTYGPKSSYSSMLGALHFQRFARSSKKVEVSVPLIFTLSPLTKLTKRVPSNSVVTEPSGASKDP